ncbi:MAG TPA: hypothetical protein DC024_00600 [Clostridiales bacterium]|nr:hypothetical protein [Clostridiales bacterium]
MILLSNIIKAEYVIFDNRNNKQKTNHLHNQVSTHREDLFRIFNQREIILKEAEEKALEIISTAEKNAQCEIAEYKKNAYKDGYNAGMEAGKNKGYEEGYTTGKTKISEILLEQNKEKLNEIAKLIETIESEKLKIISRYENELTKLSIEIAERIIRYEIDAKGDIVSGIIKNVIKDYRNVDWIKLYISGKDDAVAIQADKELINELKKIAKDVKIEVMDELKKGSAIVETADGIVEANIDTQLKNLKEMVLNKNAG